MTEALPATETRRPALDPADAQVIAEKLYGLSATVEELSGDRDRNFLLSSEQGRFVLKVAFGGKHKMLAFQSAAFDHVACRLGDEAPLRIAKVLAPVSAQETSQGGDRLPSWQDQLGRECRVRLITFLAGKTLVRFRPHSPALLRSLGESMAVLDTALADFEHPEMARDCVWDMGHAGRTLRERLPDLAGTEASALVEPVLKRFERFVEPVLPALRRSVIHGDGNDHNVLVGVAATERQAEGQDEAPRITGIIDFGDMIHSQLVHEVAIAAAYAGLGKEDPLRAAAHVVAGYHSVLPLEDREIALLFDLIRGRIGVSISMAAYQRRLEPENEYLSVSEAPGLRSLELLAEVDPEFAHCVFRAACGLDPCAEGRKVPAWLDANRGSFGKVVEGDVSRAPILDLSIGSPLSAELRHGAELWQADAAELLEGHVNGLLEDSGAGVVVGRYNEPRLLYTGAQFSSVKGLEHPETRTVHLGIDLFQPAGSPVYAPLDGVVHSLADNTDELDYGPTLILQHQTGGPESIDFYTLYGHLDRESLAGKFEGMKVAKGDRIARLGSAEVNGGWAPHLHFQVMLETFGRYGEFPGVAAPTDRELWLGLCPDPSPILGLGEGAAVSAPSADDILGRRRRVLGRNLSISYRKPLHIVAGQGCYLYDAEGRAYLDAVNNVPHVGHCHPKVVAAGRDQMAVLNTNTRYLHEDLVAYAERLTATFPDPLNVCIFCCTGSEANDLALRMARIYTGGSDFVVVDAAYHGHTLQLIELSPYKFDGPGGAGAPGSTHVVPLPCGYRGLYKHHEPDIGSRYAAHVADACSTATSRGDKVAAFICESILGCGGQVVLPAGYLAQAYQHVRAAGGLCLADEVQVGFGRVGSHMWAFETQGVVPDIVTLGKPIGNGHPLSAVITTAEIADKFANGMEYFNTFGGNPVSCRIGSAVLDVIEEQGLRQNAAETGGFLLSRLKTLSGEHPIVGEVRGLGLFVGIELVRDYESLEPAAAAAAYVAERMRDHGILVSTDGPLHNVLKIKPPLVFNRAEADRLVRTLDRILGEDAVRSAGPRSARDARS